MSQKHRPLTHKEVISVLRAFNFQPRPQKGTSHVHWVKTTIVRGEKKLWKVTVDEPKSPFSHDLVTFMARQAGIRKKEFYKVALDKNYRKQVAKEHKTGK